MLLPDNETMLEMFYQMKLARLLNDGLLELKLQKHIKGPVHFVNGQEAVGIGVGVALRNDDYIVSNHRGLAHWIGKGIDPKKVTCEILGKAAGCCKGKGGEMLIADLAHGIMSTTVIGGCLPLSCGWALSFKMKKSEQLIVCFFGDGAANTGAFNEALNFASILKLPVIFLCENNRYALGTNLERTTVVPDLAIRSVGYGIKGYVQDGNDALELYALIKKVSPDVRAGRGPVLIEAKTYRTIRFSTNDRGGYQPEEEIKCWMAKEPIERLKKQLLLLNVASELEIQSKEEKAVQDAEGALACALEAPYPPPEALYEDLYP